MSLIDARHSALLLVDLQTRLMPAIDRGAEVLAHAVRLADIARELEVPIVGTEQNPAGLGPNDAAIYQRCGLVIPKMHFDACVDGVVPLLKSRDGVAAEHIVLAGCEAHVCLLQTALGLLDRGLAVWVVAQASGSRTAENHALAMQRLQRAGAVIVSVEMVAFEWLRTCEHRKLRQILKLLKEPLATAPLATLPATAVATRA